MVSLEYVFVCLVVYLSLNNSVAESVPLRASGSMRAVTAEEADISSSSLASSELQCGHSELHREMRIVGGKPAGEGQWPWQVMLRETSFFGILTAYKCGGVLISDRLVLTAAHCMPQSGLTTYTATLGMYRVDEDYGVTIPVRRMIVHKDFDPTNFNNDLAVLELDYPAVFSSRIAPICLPDSNDNFTGRRGLVTGWGKLSFGGLFARVLQGAMVPIISREECGRMYKNEGLRLSENGTFVCAGFEAGEVDACDGDSGGPLAVRRSDGRWVLAGTVSFGVKCAEPNLPGVYVNVPRYMSWIKRTQYLTQAPEDSPTGLIANLASLIRQMHLEVIYVP